MTAAGVVVKPTLALGSWVAFTQVSDTDAMLMGDLVLLESEIAPLSASSRKAGSNRPPCTTTCCRNPPT